MDGAMFLTAALRHSGFLRLRQSCRRVTNRGALGESTTIGGESGGGLGESALPLGCESGGELEMTRTIGDDGFFCTIKLN